MENESPEVIVAVGLKAAVLVHDRMPRVPLVYTMVPSPERHDLVGAWITGIAADVPPSMELAALHRLAPEVREVGVLIGTGQAEWIRAARAAAGHLGIRLDVAVVDRVENLGPQLRDLVTRAHAIWLPADPSLATPEAFRFTLDQALAHRIPLLAFAAGLVRAGALAAAAPDLAWVGERTAESVRRIQAGERAGDVPSTDVRRVRVIANLATARAIGLEISPGALESVELVQ
jgi:putative ABC transport system substrate-binding protein